MSEDLRDEVRRWRREHLSEEDVARLEEWESRSRDQKTRDAWNLYADRHERIKGERKIFLSTLTGLSGGAIVLSITFLEKIAPSRHHRGFVVAAWCCLGLTIFVGILGSLRMILRSQQFQTSFERMVRGGKVTLLESLPFVSRDDQVTEEGCLGCLPGCLLLPEFWAGFFFGFGILLLTIFAVVNLF